MAAVASFCIIFGGSLLIGAFFGIGSALVFKMMDMRHHKDLIFMQAALSFAFPWAAYFTSEALELSGIVTILFCGMIMAVYTRYNFHEDARKLTAQGYKCIAVVAETYVFVYLGMAVFTFPIFQATTYGLILVATLACFVGRLHIYVGSFLFNCFRTKDSHPPAISAAYMFIMWFSGLRGGVAFALASVSFANNDFPTICGGLTEEQKLVDPHCQDAGMSDSLAILQTTLMIAAFTIFVFGGAITDVAIHLGVLSSPEFLAELSKKEAEAEEKAGSNMHTSCLMPCLTFEIKESAALRQDGAVDVHAAGPIDLMHPVTPSGSYKSVSALDNTEPGKVIPLGTLGGMSIDDKIDEMRLALPKSSTEILKKLLDECNGDYHQAIITGQSKGFAQWANAPALLDATRQPLMLMLNGGWPSRAGGDLGRARDAQVCMYMKAASLDSVQRRRQMGRWPDGPMARWGVQRDGRTGRARGWDIIGAVRRPVLRIM